MGFFNHIKAREAFKDDEYMQIIIDALKGTDMFHLLRDTTSEKAKKTLATYPNIKSERFKKWITVCDGGYLYDIVLLSIDGKYDRKLETGFDTYREYNSKTNKKNMGLPENCIVFAITPDGNPYYFAEDGETVCGFSLDEQEVVETYETFGDFLAEMINDARDLIADEVLEPIPLKLCVDSFEDDNYEEIYGLSE